MDVEALAAGDGVIVINSDELIDVDGTGMTEGARQPIVVPG